MTSTAAARSLLLVAILAPAASMAGDAIDLARFRPPAAPLVVHDPYFSIWSFADRLNEDWPRHWTGKPHALAGMVRVDGKAYRFLGLPPGEPARQVRLEVEATRTTYAFEAGPIELGLTFLTPALPADLDVLSRPATYIRFEARATDGKPHDVAIWFDAAGELATNVPDQAVTWDRSSIEDPALDVLRIGTVEQPVLEKAGDDLRIDWGWLLLAAPRGDGVQTAVAAAQEAREAFARDGSFPSGDDAGKPRAARDRWPVLACAFPLGSVGGEPAARHAIVAYDDVWSIQHAKKKLRP